MSRPVQNAHSYAKDDYDEPKSYHEPVRESYKDHDNFAQLLQQAIHEPDHSKNIRVPGPACHPNLQGARRKLVITHRYPPLEEHGSHFAESLQHWRNTAPVVEMPLEALPGYDTRTLVGYASSLVAEKSRSLKVHNGPPVTPSQFRPSVVEEHSRFPAPAIGGYPRFPVPAFRSLSSEHQKIPSTSPPIFFSTASQHPFGYLAPESMTPFHNLSKEHMFSSFNDHYSYRMALYFNDRGFKPTVYSRQGEGFSGSQAEERPWYKQATRQPQFSIVENSAFMKFWCSTSASPEGNILKKLLSTGDSDLIYAIKDNDLLGIGRSMEEAKRDWSSGSTQH
ncbi:hypothetical protein DL95DRAFT_409926 [Leptodontidium sp. 2 PMI_412]|nr:hypothetical protein DL95DRAFT_409926 [Leptodontidium sp. 2 PMI_412]